MRRIAILFAAIFFVGGFSASEALASLPTGGDEGKKGHQEGDKAAGCGSQSCQKIEDPDEKKKGDDIAKPIGSQCSQVDGKRVCRKISPASDEEPEVACRKEQGSQSCQKIDTDKDKQREIACQGSQSCQRDFECDGVDKDAPECQGRKDGPTAGAVMNFCTAPDGTSAPCPVADPPVEGERSPS
jgi:hypothetical protein